MISEHSCLTGFSVVCACIRVCLCVCICMGFPWGSHLLWDASSVGVPIETHGQEVVPSPGTVSFPRS